MQTNFTKLVEFLRKENIDDEKINQIVPKYANVKIVGNCVTVYMSVMFPNEQNLSQLRKAKILNGVPMFLYFDESDGKQIIASYPELRNFLVPRQNPNVAKCGQFNHKPKHHPAYK